MIPRYTREVMAELWSDEAKYARWLEVEIAVAEALAQTSGLLLGVTWKERHTSHDATRRDLFLANMNIKFTSLCGPGDTLRLEALFKKEFGRLFSFDVAAFVTDRHVAKGSLMLAEEEKK